jgi:DNA-binding MarR family transcriptional regulator
MGRKTEAATRINALKSPFVAIDSYILDILMRDLVGHDQHPAAFLVYLFLFREASKTRRRRQRVSASLRMIADATGLSKSAVQIALQRLHRRQLIATSRAHRTAVPHHRVLCHWR